MPRRIVTADVRERFRRIRQQVEPAAQVQPAARQLPTSAGAVPRERAAEADQGDGGQTAAAST